MNMRPVTYRIVALVWLAPAVFAASLCGGVAATARPVPAVVRPVEMATMVAVNVPDGRCHEDMPCWANHNGAH